MKAVFFDFKTAKENWFEELVQTYLKKIKPYCALEVNHLKTIHVEREDQILKLRHEEKVLLEKLTSDDFVILFDVLGKKMTSEQFAESLQKATNSGKKRIVYIVGGAYGVSEEIKKRAQLKVSLSDLTMNHLIAEAVALEQIYRGYTILNRIPYHNS